MEGAVAMVAVLTAAEVTVVAAAAAAAAAHGPHHFEVHFDFVLQPVRERVVIDLGLGRVESIGGDLTSYAVVRWVVMSGMSGGLGAGWLTEWMDA